MSAVNDRVYIHEFIDITGLNRANYMHHMTANWSPLAQEQRGQLCFGVWSLIGSTGAWPQVVNMWEERGLDGLAASFDHETSGRGGYDPALEKWWAKAFEFRRGGLDRIMLPAPWQPTIGQLTAEGVRGTVYAHDLVRVRPGAAADLLERARQAPAGDWRLAGAFTTAMRNDDEALLLWAIPTFASWAAGEQGSDLAAWKVAQRDVVEGWQRVLLVDAPLSPLRTGRQPSRDDRTDWED